MRKKITASDIIQPSESEILHACIKLLYQWGLQPIRNNTGGFSKKYTDKNGNTKTHRINFGKKGSGDILVCSKKGRWVELEVKAPGGEQSSDQIIRQEHIDAMYGVYAVIRSVDDLVAMQGVLL